MSSIPAEAAGDDRGDIRHALAAPFAADEVRWKPQAVSGQRALAVCYINARAVMDRLDEVLGVAGWQDAYIVLPDGNVVCRLRLMIDGQWVERQDVGGPSEQPDDGDKCKAAFSDALKRAAVKFGVGRYLYRLPSQWVDYDPQKRQFIKTPKLPPWAVPPLTEGRALPQPASPQSNDRTATVNGSQLAELERLLTLAAADRAKFLAAYGVKQLADLKADLYDKAVSQLQKKLERKAAPVRQAVAVKA